MFVRVSITKWRNRTLPAFKTRATNICIRDKLWWLREMSNRQRRRVLQIFPISAAGSIWNLDYLATLVLLFLSTPFLSGSLFFSYKYPFFPTPTDVCVNCIVLRTCESVNSTITCENHLSGWRVSRERAGWVGQGWIIIANQNPQWTVAIFGSWQFVCQQGVHGCR